MKTITEITEIISNAIADAAQEVPSDECENIDEYNIRVCTERVFIDDYEKANGGDLLRPNQDYDGDMHDPLDTPYQNTIFIILKFGQGQVNQAILNMPVRIQCVSEQNDFAVASAVLRQFCNKYNFEYTDGLVMSFYTPEVTASAQEMYEGYRSLISCSGTVKVPEDGLAFVTEIWSYDSSESKWFRIPFITMNESWSAQGDPQSYAGMNGRTMNLNRQSTSTMTFSCYMWNFNDAQIAADATRTNACLTKFTKNVLSAKYSMNRRFKLYFKTNVLVSKGDAAYDSTFYEKLKDIDHMDESYYLPCAEGTFTMVSSSYGQSWGDINTRSLSFTESSDEDNEAA